MEAGTWNSWNLQRCPGRKVIVARPEITQFAHLICSLALSEKRIFVYAATRVAPRATVGSSRSWCGIAVEHKRTKQYTMKPIFPLVVVYCVILLISNASAQCFHYGCKRACYGVCDGCRNRCSSSEANKRNCVKDCDNACWECINIASTCKYKL